MSATIIQSQHTTTMTVQQYQSFPLYKGSTKQVGIYRLDDRVRIGINATIVLIAHNKQSKNTYMDFREVEIIKDDDRVII